MSDLATLGLQFTTQGADQAIQKMDGIAKGADRAEKATDGLSAANDRAVGAIAKMVASIDRSLKQLVEIQRMHQQAAGATAQHGAAVEKLTNDMQQASTAGMYFGASFKATQSTMGGAAAAARDWGGAVAQADAHVMAYRQHLEQLNKTMGQQDAHVAAYRQHLDRLNDQLPKAVDNSKALTMAGLNLGRQFADVGVTLAMGMNPFMIAIQQGPQIIDAFQTAALQMGTTVRGAMVALGTAIWTAIAPLLPFIVGLGVAVGTVAGAFGLATRSMRQDVGDVAASMNLTKDQLEKVKEAGVSTSITIGDTFKATFQEIGANIAAAMKPATDWLADTWGVTLDSITEAAATGTQAVLAFFLGTYRAIMATWRSFPAAFGDMVIQGANAAIVAINGLINRAVDGLNYLDAKFAGGHMQIDRFAAKLLDNPVAGAAASDAEATADAYQSAFEDVGDMMDNFAAGVRRRATAIRRAAIAEAAGDPEKGRKAGKSELEKQIEETERYIQALKDQAATLGLSAIATKEYEIAQRALKAPTEELRKEVEKYGAALLDKMRIEAAGLRPLQNQIALVEREIELLGASNRVRAVELALLAKRQEMAEKGLKPTDAAWAAGETATADLANAQEDLAEKTFRTNDALTYQLDLLTLLDDRARDAAAGMAEAFGSVGQALGDVLTLTTNYARREEDIYVRRQAMLKQAGTDYELIGRIVARSNEESRAAQVAYYGDVLSASKQFFGEQTGAYKALQAVEMAYRTVQFAMAAKSVAMGAWEAAQNIPKYLAQATAAATAGAAKMFASLGPFGFAAVAAMGVVLAAFGLRSLGGGGGGVSTPTMPETNEGTGTVLGDSSAQSNSIGKSVENAEKFWNRDLQMTNEMVRSLRAIENEIGSMTTLIARQIGVGGGFDTSGLGLGTNTTRSLFGLLSTTRTSSLVGQGLQLNAGTLANLIAQGVTGSLYQIIQNTKTKSGFLGIGGGTTTWNTETSTPMDRELGMQLGRILASLRSSVLTAAGTIGVEGAEATLNAMVLNLGRIDFTGLSSSEISEKLNAVFSAAGDQMVQAILPGLVNYQQAGEGLLETLTRLATTFTAVDTTLESMGMTFNAVGLGSLNARLRLVELSGGLEAFTESASFFVSEFLTEAQQIAPIQAAVSAELERLGLASDISRSQFADLVMGLDVSTEAGAQMYAALMALAPALDRVLDYQEELAGSTQNLSQLEAQRRELEIRLMEAQGRIAEALAARRAEELAAMDEALRPLQLAIWAQQDLAAAAQELAATEAAAAEQLASIATQRRDMEIELLEAQGRATEALQARRDLELAALDATLRPLQLAIWAALDAAAAQDELTRAQEEAADAARRLAEQRADLEIQLLEATGRSAEAVARQREMELAALDATLRPLQEQIWAALDAAAAAEELAAAQEAQADAARQLAELRRSMEIDLMEALGQSSEALAARRQMELEALDPTLRALQEQIWAAQDAAAANEALAQAQQEAADRAAEIGRQRRDLDIQLMEATGNAAGALAARRADELAAMDETLRGLQQSVWAAQDAAAAAEAARQAREERQQRAMDAVNAARDALTASYEREAGALQETIDKFGGFGDSLRAFRKDLEGLSGTGSSYAGARAEFERVAALARTGNADALGSLQGVSQTYLDAALQNAGSALEYQRILASVMGAVDGAIGAADGQKSLAEQQLAALDAQVSGLITVNESVLSVVDAIDALNEALTGARRAGVRQFATGGVFGSPTYFDMGQMAEAGPEAILPLARTSAGLGVHAVNDNGSMEEVVAELRAVRAELADIKAATTQTGVNTGQMKRKMDRQEVDGVYVRGPAPGDPVETVAA